MERSRGAVAENVARYGLNAGFVAELRRRFEIAPGSVDPAWAEHFREAAESPADPLPVALPMPRAALSRALRDVPAAVLRDVPAAALPDAPAAALPDRERRSPASKLEIDENARVVLLIDAYRSRGHRIARSDPLGGNPTYFPELEPAHCGFGDDDLPRIFHAGGLPGGPTQTLADILESLRTTYCGSIGVEYTHVQDPGRKAWLQQRMEADQNQPRLGADLQRRILEKLSQAELFERFLHTKFLGQKRFSLEGAESLIPLLDTLAETAPRFGVRELVLGTTHRGRLNILANVLGKSYEAIFGEFEDSPVLDAPFGSGDVKYHKGYSNDRIVRSGERVHLSLTGNPSHLEAVNPVVEGRVRAKQVREPPGAVSHLAPREVLVAKHETLPVGNDLRDRFVDGAEIHFLFLVKSDKGQRALQVARTAIRASMVGATRPGGPPGSRAAKPPSPACSSSRRSSSSTASNVAPGRAWASQ